jgi:hypothetical protein
MSGREHPTTKQGDRTATGLRTKPSVEQLQTGLDGIPGHQGTEPWSLVPGHFFILFYFLFWREFFFSHKQ